MAGVLVKRFRGAAPAQERVLDAFQRQGCPADVAACHLRGRKRMSLGALRNTVKSLNRGQGPARLHSRSPPTARHYAGAGPGLCNAIVSCKKTA
jgi:hypothetical protein